MYFYFSREHTGNFGKLSKLGIYFLMIRPENKRRKTHQEMLSSLDLGNEVVTAGGLLGKVSKISDQYIELSVADNTKIKVQKTSISTVLPKGTLKSI